MAENYVLLETIELTQSAASVTFDNIPQSGYTDLKVVASYRGTTAQVYEISALRFNGLNTNLSSRSIEGNGSAASSITNSYIYFGAGDGASATANTFSNIEAYIPNYTSSNYKSVSIDAVGETNGTTIYSQLTAGLWSSTAAVTSVEIVPTGSFVQYSTFSLYGVADVNTTPVLAPLATGGNIVANDGTYWYHAFLSSGTFTPQTALTCDALVVAGGGGGGTSTGGGGGGAGGLLAFTSQSLTNQNYAVTVGAGGSGGASVDGTNGSDSQFNSLTLVKGGGGGAGAAQTSPRAGLTGGSGGGGSSGNTGNNPGAGGSATSEQGNAGGASTNSSGGGGGGAGQVGASGSTGLGGNGINTYSSWASATSTGVSGYYAGGGGGSWYPGGTGRSGGSGGGGTGGNYQGNTQTAGTRGTGGGGGAGGGTSTINAQPGGSGIVIIRYAMV